MRIDSSLMLGQLLVAVGACAGVLLIDVGDLGQERVRIDSSLMLGQLLVAIGARAGVLLIDIGDLGQQRVRIKSRLMPGQLLIAIAARAGVLLIDIGNLGQERVRIGGGQVLGQLRIAVGADNDVLVIDILARGQNDGRVDFQLDGGRAGDDQHDAHDLRAAAALGHQWLVAGRAVGHRAQVAGLVEDTDFTYPPAAHVLGQDLLDDDLAGVGRVDGQLVQARAAYLAHQRLLRAHRHGQIAVAVAHGQVFQFQGLAQGDGVGQLGLAHFGQDGKVCAHG